MPSLDFGVMDLTALRRACNSYGLSDVGNETVLRNRLRRYLESGSTSASSPSAASPSPSKPIVRPEVLQNVKAKLLERARAQGYRSLVRVFSIMDDDGNIRVSPTEFRGGLERYGVVLTNAEVDTVFAAFDRDRSGDLSITEFLRALRGEMNSRRVALVQQAFQQFDRTGDGIVNAQDLVSTFGKNIHRHPDVESGKKSPEEVLNEFMATWWDKNRDSVITWDEFADYYTDVSANIDNDDYFELMIRNAWHISGGEGWAENTANLRVLVEHSNGSEEVVEIVNDLGIDKTDNATIMALLKQQGIQDIRRVKIFG